MLFEVKFYYKDGSVSCDLINCERPEDWSDQENVYLLTSGGGSVRKALPSLFIQVLLFTFISVFSILMIYKRG